MFLSYSENKTLLYETLLFSHRIHVIKYNENMTVGKSNLPAKRWHKNLIFFVLWHVL